MNEEQMYIRKHSCMISRVSAGARYPQGANVTDKAVPETVVVERQDS